MTTFTRFLPDSIRTPIIRRAVLTAAGLALTGGAIAGPAAAAHASPSHDRPHTTAAVIIDRGDGHGDRGDNRSDRAKDVHIDYQAQPNFYYCGPASTRIALTAAGHNPSQDEVAEALGTTEAGTPSAEDTTRVLNQVIGGSKYTTTALPDKPVKPEQIDKLVTDIKSTIDDNRAIVANIAGTATDTDGNIHSYEGGHYIVVAGYHDDGHTATIADPANPNTASYQVDTADLANWMATHGYSH